MNTTNATAPASTLSVNQQYEQALIYIQAATLLAGGLAYATSGIKIWDSVGRVMSGLFGFSVIYQAIWLAQIGIVASWLTGVFSGIAYGVVTYWFRDSTKGMILGSQHGLIVACNFYLLAVSWWAQSNVAFWLIVGVFMAFGAIASFTEWGAQKE